MINLTHRQVRLITSGCPLVLLIAGGCFNSLQAQEGFKGSATTTITRPTNPNAGTRRKKKQPPTN